MTIDAYAFDAYEAAGWAPVAVKIAHGRRAA